MVPGTNSDWSCKYMTAHGVNTQVKSGALIIESSKAVQCTEQVSSLDFKFFKRILLAIGVI